MLNIKGDKTPLQITTSIKGYAESLTPGYHLAWTSTGADIDVVGQPVANTGFLYEIVNFGGTPILIKAIPFSEDNNIYLLRKHGKAWRPWVELVGNPLGGGDKCLSLSVKGGDVNAENCFSDWCVKHTNVSKPRVDYTLLKSGMSPLPKKRSKICHTAFRHLERATYCNNRVFRRFGDSQSHPVISRDNYKKFMVWRNYSGGCGNSTISHLQKGVAA